MATINKILWSNRHRFCNLKSSFLKSLTGSNKNSFVSTINPNLIRNVSTTNCLFDEILIKMPALSPTMASGTIVKWHKKEGDKIAAGDILCEVQTDKAVVAYEFDDDAILAKILVNENSNEIMVGDLIAIVCGEDDDWKNVKIPDDLKAVVTDDSVTPTSKPETVQKTNDKPVQKIDPNSIRISPSARNLMDQYSIELSQIQPTGPHGALTKEDVMKFVSANNLKPKDYSAKSTVPKEKPKAPTTSDKVATISPYVDIEITSMRKTIAKRLTDSKSNTPHAYISIKCNMDELLKLRKQFKQQNLPVSLNDMIVKATALALKQVPAMNCQWDNSTETIQIIRDIDVSIAVATPSGLITPIIRNANRLTLEEISSTSRELIGRAKENKLKPEEFIGGTFSISNLGMYDIDHFVGVINPPQAAILAVGSTRQKFVGDPDNYQLCNQAIMSLSYDARAIDEEVAAMFMEKLQGNFDNPDLLLHSDGSSNRRLASLI